MSVLTSILGSAVNTDAADYLGKPTRRVDGPAKVSGQAKYAAEFNVPGLAYGYIVSSAKARGTIKRINTAEVEAVPGVLKVFTHENAPRTAWLDRSHRDQIASKGGSPFRPLYQAELQYSQQPVALVVGETFEIARFAASLVQVEYDEKPHETDLAANRGEAHPPTDSSGGYTPPPKPRGKPDAAFEQAPLKVEAQYSQPLEFPHPM